MLIKAMDIASSGMRTYEDVMQVSAGNAVNANTTGYMKKAFSISDLQHGKQLSSNNSLDRGRGAKLARASLVRGQGELKETNATTHYAIVGEGFFKLRNLETGDEYLTRAGDFVEVRNLSGEEPGYYLGTHDGLVVVGADGRGLEYDPQNRRAVLDVGIFEIGQHEKLRDAGNSRYLYRGEDEPRVSAEAILEVGMLEGSAVEVSDEAIDLMVAKQGHNASGKIFQLVGAAQDEVTNLMG